MVQLSEIARSLQESLIKDIGSFNKNNSVRNLQIYTRILEGSLQEFSNMVTDGRHNLSLKEVDAAVNEIIDSLQIDDGIVFHTQGENVVWLRAALCIDGHFPSRESWYWEYLRVDTITKVSIEVAYGGGDEMDWQYFLVVSADNSKYYASATRFRASWVQKPLKRILTEIGLGFLNCRA
jgi:hypothetical protein